MKAFIGSDYDRGLRMLKDYLELNSIDSTTKVEGVVDTPSTLYAGKTYYSSMADIAQSMGNAFPEVHGAAQSAGAQINGQPFSLYNKMDLVKQACNCLTLIEIQ